MEGNFCTSVSVSEHDFHIRNANWPMKCEAKMAAHKGQFCTSVSVPYAVFYVSFSLPRDFLHFLKSFLWKHTPNISSKYRNEFKTFKYISTKLNRVTVYIFFTKISFQTDEKPDKSVSKNYFSKLVSARPLFTTNLPFLDNLVDSLGHRAIMTPLKYSNM